MFRASLCPSPGGRTAFHCLWFLSCCGCCHAGESGGKMCALCRGCCLSQATSSASSWSLLYLLIKDAWSLEHIVLLKPSSIRLHGRVIRSSSVVTCRWTEGTQICHLLGGADTSLAWPTSRCRRMESIVSLERGVCSCAELQVFSCYRGWKEACQATCAISTTSRCVLSSSFFPARQGAEGNSRHSERNIKGKCTIVCHCQKLGGPV